MGKLSSHLENIHHQLFGMLFCSITSINVMSWSLLTHSHPLPFRCNFRPRSKEMVDLVWSLTNDKKVWKLILWCASCKRWLLLGAAKSMSCVGNTNEFEPRVTYAVTIAMICDTRQSTIMVCEPKALSSYRHAAQDFTVLDGHTSDPYFKAGTFTLRACFGIENLKAMGNTLIHPPAGIDVTLDNTFVATLHKPCICHNPQ